MTFATSRVAVLSAGIAFAMAAGHAAAFVTLGFENITANNPVSAANGEAQLWVTIQPSGSLTSFIFQNIGTEAMSITDVYFDDGPILGLAQVINGSGVSFVPGANPGALPGGNMLTPPFVATAAFSAESTPPTQPHGVNPGEVLELRYSLQGGMTTDDVLAAIASREVRIGLHVQGFAGGLSEGFVNQVPAPGPLALMALAGLLSRRRR
jgi:hypothetical protein